MFRAHQPVFGIRRLTVSSPAFSFHLRAIALPLHHLPPSRLQRDEKKSFPYNNLKPNFVLGSLLAALPSELLGAAAMADDLLRRQKVQRFEDFVDRRLKPDLVNAIAQRDKVFQQQQVFADLKRNIKSLETNGATCLRTMINLGSEVYAQADVPDTSHIFVDVGLGFHVEFTWSEALEFISVREVRLARQVEEYTHLIANIKAQIKMVCEGIRELLQIPVE